MVQTLPVSDGAVGGCRCGIVARVWRAEQWSMSSTSPMLVFCVTYGAMVQCYGCSAKSRWHRIQLPTSPRDCHRCGAFYCFLSAMLQWLRVPAHRCTFWEISENTGSLSSRGRPTSTIFLILLLCAVWGANGTFVRYKCRLDLARPPGW